ncbi:MAG: hypothetical protein ACE5K8_03130 [Candidatus Zixiibacteriota bacterium]
MPVEIPTASERPFVGLDDFRALFKQTVGWVASPNLFRDKKRMEPIR